MLSKLFATPFAAASTIGGSLFLAAAVGVGAWHYAAPETHTVSWFLASPAEMQTTYTTCQNESGNAGRTANCVNAEQAEAQQAEKNVWKDTPPAAVTITDPGVPESKTP